ncbi:MAG: cellulase family glycosylhydrolase [Clostridiales bacterium]|nr:cellulase family glycosylhydrolase [Clostridiales bacterium]
MKRIILFIAAALFTVIISAHADEEAVYNSFQNSVTVDASGYSTVCISAQNNSDDVVYINQSASQFSSEECFRLKSGIADGAYTITLGGGEETKQISFTKTAYPFDVNFSKTEQGKVKAQLKNGADKSGVMIFALYSAENALIEAGTAELLENADTEYVFNKSETGQKIKLMLWNGPDTMIPVSAIYSISTDSVLKEPDPPDVLRVTSAGELAKQDGKTVVLRGVNFGGWLVQETWMCPVLAFNSSVTVKSGQENAWANLDTLNSLESKFGTEQTAALVQAYQDNYITEWDFEKVKSLGFNCIRIPFWYRNFMSDENGTYITADDNENPGFKKLDWACDMADKCGLYLILDMHGCPGGQNGDHSSGKAGRNYLYNQSAYQDIMEDLWVKIADRYKDRTCVAAYDIMNEPGNNATTAYGVLSANVLDVWSDKTKRNAVYDRMIKAIREVDPYHVITVEGIWRLSYLPQDPQSKGWTDIMYQLHSYDSDDETTTTLVNSLADIKSKGVAAFMGEFNPAVYNKNIVSQMNAKNISYTLWNYKTTSFLNDSNSSWGLYYRTYTWDQMQDICGDTSMLNSIHSTWSSSGGIMFHTGNLTDAQIKQLYTNWWSASQLNTNGFTENSTLKGYLN